MRTDDLINRLARDARPVRPLAPPWRRTGRWLAGAAAFVAGVVLIMAPRPDIAAELRDVRFWIEQLAALATAVLAAHAALALTKPGTASRIALMPLAPAALWLGSQGIGCVAAFASPIEVSVSAEPECLVLIALAGSLPAVILVAMLRRGFSALPRLNMALAALSSAALGNVGLRFFHEQDAALMILVWQTGSVALLSLVGWLLGREVFRAPIGP